MNENELTMLRIWKEDALEAMEDHNRAYAAQADMIAEMHKVITACADALHQAQLCLSGYIEIKENSIPKIKRKTKTPNVEITGDRRASGSLPG